MMERGWKNVFNRLSFAVIFGCLFMVSTWASESEPEPDLEPETTEHVSSLIGVNEADPGVLLEDIAERRLQRESLLGKSPLKGLHDASKQAWDSIYDATNLKLGLSFNHMFQWVSDALPDRDDWGTTTDADFVGAWHIANKGTPTLGQMFFHVEGRWDYGTTGPQVIGFTSLGAAGGTANAFSSYTPTFLLRNLYWEQGSVEAGWSYRIGKITPDSILATSRHITPLTTFLPNGGTGFFTNGYPDSGIGAVGVWHPNDRLRVLGLVSDANADRSDFGCPGCGEYYYAVELGAKMAPRTEKSGYSKFTIWHNDGNDDGTPINAMTGQEGWGWSAKLEQELSADGEVVGILRYGKSYDGAAAYKEQAGIHFLFYNPPGPVLDNDLIGVAANWLRPITEGSRDEYNLEVFYRFALFGGLDARLSYQYIIDPALQREFDHASVFSFGLRTSF